MEYEIVIGLEIHAQLLTNTKLFCNCRSRFGDAPNTNGCPVCLGLPGALPVLNRRAVEMAVRMGLAVGCTINTRSIFARKNYFYPDKKLGPKKIKALSADYILELSCYLLDKLYGELSPAEEYLRSGNIP